MNFIRLFRNLFAPTIDSAMIEGSWRDSDSQNVETYNSDRSLDSRVDQVMTVPVDQSGFVGTVSVPILANASGTWSLERNCLTVNVAKLDNLDVGTVTLDSENGNHDDQFIQQLSTELRDHYRDVLPGIIAGQTRIRTIVSVTTDSLVTQDETGEIEHQERC